MRNQKLFDFLQTGRKSMINNAEVEAHIKKFSFEEYKDISIGDTKTVFAEAILGNPSNNIKGYDKFEHKELIIGVTQFIDNLIMKYGLKGLQIFEHDYTYYQRLDPDIKFAKIGQLTAEVPLIMSMPFAGHCDVHKNMQDILDECYEKNIDVHLDCAWLTCAENISFDFSHPNIKSFASSLSKAYSLDWNRIGIRWTKQKDDTDAITIYNNFKLYNDSLCKIGYHMVNKFPINYYWQTYRELYHYGCRQTYTFPTKIIWLTKGLDGELFGMSKLLEHLYDVGMTH